MIQLKRIVKSFFATEDMENWMNGKSDEGYTVESITPTPVLHSSSGGATIVVMRLKTDPSEDYSAFEDLMEVPIDKSQGDPLGTPMIAKCIGDGWRIINVYKGTKDTPSTAMMAKVKVVKID